MSKTIKELSEMDGRVYVYFRTKELCTQFFKQAEHENFTFSDGIKPTEKHTTDIIAVNQDMTVNYVGTNGRIAFGSNTQTVGDKQLIRIDFEKYICG